ncbi:hypothetical protein LCGC14_0754650 [marine sediment metagenome]|uniref:Uncharacterized protein n=1 Tax=marine sediment metagenome TaxID=412755 RepID=A0A0F9Q315_9ZZZZ
MRVLFELEALPPAALRLLLGCLVDIDRQWLRDNPGTPCIYDSAVRYRYERDSGCGERFKDVATVLRDGFGACADLSCWRVAKLRNRGERATVVWRVRILPTGEPLYHIFVRRAGGKYEDPSKRLGMKDDI